MDFTREEQEEFLKSLGYTVESIVYQKYDTDRYEDIYPLPSETIYIAYKGERPVTRPEETQHSHYRYVPSCVFKEHRLHAVFRKEYVLRLFNLLTHQHGTL